MNGFALAPVSIVAFLCFTALAGCATGPIGAVVPLEGGQYQSSVSAPDPQTALKTVTHDAELTCSKVGAKSGKFVVVSQTMKDKEGKDIKASDNKVLDSTIAVGLRYFGMESKDEVRATTIFKCM